jgi:trimeric autotransporter adhesin
MKTKLLLTILFFAFTIYVGLAQIPQGFNYQALAGDLVGNPIRNTAIQVKMSILSDTIVPVIVWEELFSSVQTKPNGTFSLVIGTGVRQSTSTVASFNKINWSAGSLYLKTQINLAGIWKSMGSTKLWSVPYAMVAGNFSGKLNQLGVNGLTTSPDTALFEVKNLNGQTVFAVYNEGVRVYVDDGVAKGKKGGFAIGGFGTAKGVSQSLMMISPDSVRIYVDKSTAKGKKGGFAIGGFSTAKGSSENFLKLTEDNYFIGQNSGVNNTTGLYNSFLGYMSGYKNTEGLSNTFFGDSTGLNNTSGSYNVFLGKDAGYSNLTSVSNVFIGDGAGKLAKETSTSDASYNVVVGTYAGYNNNGIYNVFMGQEAGYSNLRGNQNVFMGMKAGFLNDTASFNVAIGTYAGYANMGTAGVFIGNFAGSSNTDGSYNVLIGNNAGTSNTTGESNVVLGGDAGYYNETGSNNTFVGNLSGTFNKTGSYNTYIGSNTAYTNTAGSNNVMIGSNAGYYELGSNKLVIANNSSATPSSGSLIYGDFSANQLRFNANVGINSVPSATYKLYITGSAYSTVGFYIPSDIRLKKNVEYMDSEGVISKLKSMNVIRYNYTDEVTRGDKSLDGKYIGVIAQDIETTFPEAVKTDENGYKAVNMNTLTAILLQAIKDQQKQIDALKTEIEKLKAR